MALSVGIGGRRSTCSRSIGWSGPNSKDKSCPFGARQRQLATVVACQKDPERTPSFFGQKRTAFHACSLSVKGFHFLLASNNKKSNVRFVVARFTHYGLVTIHPRVSQGLRSQRQPCTSNTSLCELLSPQVSLYCLHLTDRPSRVLHISQKM